MNRLPASLSTRLLLITVLLGGCASHPKVQGPSAREQVMSAERAFAKTMVDRDFVGFQGFLSAEAVFFGDHGTLTGKPAIADAWQTYYNSPSAPFSWEPSDVEVLQSGRLALSTGPVYDPRHVRIGTFNSIWRLDDDGHWRIVFDKGSQVCN